MRAALLGVCMLLSGCSLVFDGDRHRGGPGMDGGATDAGDRDAGPGVDGDIVCNDHDDCPIDPFLPICSDPDEDGVKTCQEFCGSEDECVGHPAGELCVEQLCGCEDSGDCPFGAAPHCLQPFDTFCVPCVQDDHCPPGQVCEDASCELACQEDEDCATEVGEVCRRDRCVPASCDADMDGFTRDDPTGGCPVQPPYDCNDDEPGVFPGALPDCSTPERESCMGSPADALVMASEAGFAFGAPVGGLTNLTTEGYRLDVALDGSGDARVAVAFAAPGAVGFQSLRMAADGSVSSLAPVTPFGMWDEIHSYDMARADSGAIEAAVSGLRAVGPRFQLVADGASLSPLHAVEVPTERGVAMVTAGPMAMRYGLLRVTIAGNEFVTQFAEDGTTRNAAVNAHPPNRSWLVAADDLAMGNQAGGAFLWAHGAATTFPIAGTSDGYRGALTRIPSGEYVGAVPAMGGGLAWFAAPSNCGANVGPCAMGASMSAAPIPGDAALPALARGAGDTVLLLVREGSAGSHRLRLRGARVGEPLPPGITLLDRPGSNVEIRDLAMDSLVTAEQVDAVVAAVVATDSGPPELHTVRLRACLR